MNRSRLNNTAAIERHFGFKAQTLRDITLTLALLLPVIYFGREAAANRPVSLTSPIAERAYAFELRPNLVTPSLAPLNEQERSIQVIKKVWRRDAAIGIAIARCESGLRADAFNGSNTNGTWDAGLFQVNTIHGIAKETLFEPYANAGFAYALYKEQGTNPWNSSKHCWGGEL